MNTEPAAAIRIDEIRIDNLLPLVFAGEKIDHSRIWNTSFTFERGKFYSVEAESGAGKSSLCSFLFGSRKDYRGEIFFNGKNVKGLKPADWQRLRRQNIAYLPQDLMLFPELTAIGNIKLKNDLTGCCSEERINEWFSRLGIENRKDFPVGRMSVGQQQRVAIIRSLCQPFDFILLDEPVSHLDERNNDIVTGLIVERAMETGAGIISTSVGNPLHLKDPVRLKL